MPNSFYYILFSIIIISIILSWLKSETLINPTVIFNLWWGLFLFISSLNLVGIRIPSSRAYSLLFLGMAMFSLGSITFLSNKRLTLEYYHRKKIYNIGKVFKMFYFYQIIVFIVLLQLNFHALNMLKKIDVSTFRGMVFSQEGVFGDKLIIFTFFVTSAIYIGTFVTTSGILLKKLPKKYIIIPILNLLLFSFATMGRVPIFIGIMSSSLGIVYLFSITRIKIKATYIFIFLMPIILIIFLSFLRQGRYTINIFLLLKNYSVWYFTGPFTAFDFFLDNYKPGRDYDFSIIRGFFAGVEDILSPFFTRILPSFHKINDSFHAMTAPYRNLGGVATHHNSHYTMYFEFYRDAGVYGVVIYSYFLGAINSVIFNKFRSTQSITSFAILMVVMYLSLMGIMRWEFRYIWSNATLLGAVLITQKFVLKKNTNILGL